MEPRRGPARRSTGCCPRTTSTTRRSSRARSRSGSRSWAWPAQLGSQFKERLAFLEFKEKALAKPRVTSIRQPYFCSGCPHNTSTRVPEGSRATAGIGCHFMAVWMDRYTSTFTHMGAEGATWIGQAPFTSEKHIFANLGDGTYYHSGLLAIRAAVAAKVNMTYKILYNDAVAMTGGQHHDGPLDPAIISRQIAAEGVAPIVIVTDEPEKYPAGTDWAPGVTVRHRDELDAVQRELRELPGVSALIYDQTCASEKRRRRKRNEFPDPAKRVVINEMVCEGCGDCSTKSNCLSVEPLETEFGRKRTINQSTCNKDYSCVKGFCPSFVTVEGGQLKKGKSGATATRRRLPRAAGSRDYLPLARAFRHPRHRHRRHRRHHHRPDPRHGGAPRGQGRVGARHVGPGAEVRRGDVAREDRRRRRKTCTSRASARATRAW